MLPQTTLTVRDLHVGLIEGKRIQKIFPRNLVFICLMIFPNQLLYTVRRILHIYIDRFKRRVNKYVTLKKLGSR